MTPTLWITGVAGFSGRHLVEYLSRCCNRPRIVGLDLAVAAPAGVDDYHCVDMGQVDGIESLARTEPPKWVVHLAGAMPPASEAEMWHVNLGTTMSLVQGLGRAGCRGTRIVGVGSAAEYIPKSGEALTEDSPCGGVTSYGRIKWAQTLLLFALGKELGLEVVVARPFNLIGPGLPSRLVAGTLCEQFAGNQSPDEIVVGNTQSARDFVDIRDAVEAYWLLAEKGIAGQVYNVCTGNPQTIEYVLALLKEITTYSPRIRVAEERMRAADPSISYGDLTKIGEATGWRPRVELKESLSAMIQWLRR